MTCLFRSFGLTRSAACLIATLSLVGVFTYTAGAQTPPPVPPNFQDLYTQEVNYLDSFNATLNSTGNGTSYPVAYAGALTQADSNSGPQLISTGYMTGIQIQIQALKAIGVQAIMVQVGFPMLYEPFLTSQGQTQASFVNFYQQVAAMVKAQGLKLIVENNTLLSNDIQAGWDSAPYFQSLDWTTYQQARAQTAATIAQTMQPDYMVVLEEPDSEAMFTGQTSVNTPDGANAMLGQILAGLQTYRQNGLKVGAGVGTWLNGYQNFIQDFVAQPMDFIDMHIYPINNSFLPNALSIASTAASAGMPVAITECWLNKELDSELTVLTTDQVRSRNAFSFWAPLDAYYLQTLHSLASKTQMLFVTPSNSQYYYAYLDYNESTSNLTPAELVAQGMSAASQASADAIYTGTATTYHNLIVASPDATPPSAPAGLSGVSGNPTTSYLNWNLSTDDVGVAGYYILRDGVVVGTSAQLLPTTPPPSNTVIFNDLGLTEATTYTYTVEAFDLAGNVSPPSAPFTLTSADSTPPSPPGALTARAVSCYKVSLSWSPSADNTGISQYVIFWGLSPGSLIEVGNTYGTKTSYGYSSLSPSTTYYFAVQAKDSGQNTSLLSQVVAVTTPALPTPPATITATAQAATRAGLTWSASTGGMAIANYHVFRGTSPSSLTQLATTTKLSYTDTTLTAATTYYYAIQAVDTGTPPDLSAISAPVSVTTYSPPPPPGNLTATAQATTRAGLSWSPPATTGLPIANYRVWRGTTPSNLIQIATTKKTTFTDQTLAASTTYYYAVQSADTGSDLSVLSASVAVTTFAAPSVPANLTASPSSASKLVVTWSASTSGGLPVANYRLYRGTSPGNLTQIVTTTKTSYTNSSLSPGTTYYYAVEAVDTGNDHSGLSAPVAGTTYALPSTPGNVAAQASSSTLVTVSWTASTGSLAISRYNVLRGTSPGSLSQIGMTKNLTYSDRTVTAGTTYYYAVQAADSANDLSPVSAPVAVTTP